MTIEAGRLGASGGCSSLVEELGMYGCSGELHLTTPVLRCTLGVNTLSSSWTGCCAAGSTERWSVSLGVSVVWTSADLLRRRISLSVLTRYDRGCGVFVRC